jgi:hypothetical protein
MIAELKIHINFLIFVIGQGFLYDLLGKTSTEKYKVIKDGKDEYLFHVRFCECVGKLKD